MITPQQPQIDAYLSLLQNFVAQSGQQEAFSNFLNTQKQVLLQQQEQILQEHQRQIDENMSVKRKSFSITNEQLNNSGTFAGRGQTTFSSSNSFAFNPRSTRNSFNINLASVPQNKLKPPPVDKEMNDEKIKRMRAYQQFLRIQENDKNSGGLLEDFGSSVINILKVPAQKVPQYLSQGTTMLTNAIMPDKNKHQSASNRNSRKEASDQLRDSNKPFLQNESSIQLIRQSNKGQFEDSKGDYQSNNNNRNSRASEMQIIVDSSRIQISEEKREGQSESSFGQFRRDSQPESNKSLIDKNQQAIDSNNRGTNFVLGKANQEQAQKDLEFLDQMNEREKYGVFLQEEFNFSDYLGDLNLRQIQIKKDKSGRWFPMQPDCNFRITWDMLGFFFIIYQAILIPYRFCFKSKAKSYLLYFETALDIFFMIDLFLNFITGYYKKGHVIMKRGVIIKHYLRTWFIIDLLASFPYSWIISDKTTIYWPEEHEEAGNTDGTTDSQVYSNSTIDSNSTANLIYYEPFSPQNFHYRMLTNLPPVFTTTSATDFGLPALLRLLKLVRLVRLIKALQIFKLRKFIYRYEWFFFNDSVTVMSDLFKTFVVVLFIIHWISCIFFMIADIEDDQEGQATWLLLLSREDLKSAINVYVAAISFSFTTITSVGYGDIYAVTNVEMIFAMIAMLLSCGIFAYIVGFLGALFDRTNQIVGEFQKRVKRYLIYLMANKSDNKMEESEVFDMLSDNLRQELIIHLNGKMLHQTPPFYHFKLEFLLDITFILKRETYTIDEKLFEEDDQGDHLHYVTKGHVNLTHKKTATYIKEISYDTFLGELSFFSGLPRKASAKSKNFTETLTLNMGEFLQAISQYDDETNKFEIIKRRVLETEDYTLLGTKCYICSQIGHISVDCSMFSIIKGNLKEVAIEKMKQHAIKKQQQIDAHKNRAERAMRPRNEDSITSFEGMFNHSDSLEDNSIEEMFSYLERRYKKDESPKQRRPDQIPVLPPKNQNPSLNLQPIDQEESPKALRNAKITHLAQVIPLTESRNIKNIKNENFLKPHNIDLIEENSNEESVISRESILLRQSIESQLALVNKLSEIQSMSQSAQFSRTVAGGSSGILGRQTEKYKRDHMMRSQQEYSGLFRANSEENLDSQGNLQQSWDKPRLSSRGYLGQSTIRKKKARNFQDFEQIDEEEDDEMIMHQSLTESQHSQIKFRGNLRNREADQILSGRTLVPLEILGSGNMGGGILSQMMRNQQNLEEIKQDPNSRRREEKEQKRNPNLIRPQRVKKEKRAGEIPSDFLFDSEQIKHLTSTLIPEDQEDDETESLVKSEKKIVRDQKK